MFSTKLSDELLRLGGAVTVGPCQSPANAFAYDSDFPTASFHADDSGVICRLHDFKFLPDDSRGRFWDDWATMFTRIDPNLHIPFGTDENFFFFVYDNPADPTDPHVCTVDHEELDQDPFHRNGLTLSAFLAVLQHGG